MYLEQMGRELKSIRKRNGYTLKEASKITGIHSNTLCNYENNVENIKIGKLLEMLETYKVDPSIFFDNVSEYIRENKK